MAFIPKRRKHQPPRRGKNAVEFWLCSPAEDGGAGIGFANCALVVAAAHERGAIATFRCCTRQERRAFFFREPAQIYEMLVSAHINRCRPGCDDGITDDALPDAAWQKRTGDRCGKRCYMNHIQERSGSADSRD